MTHRLLRKAIDHFEVRTNPPIYILNPDTLLQTDPTRSRNQSRSRSTQSPPHSGLQADLGRRKFFLGVSCSMTSAVPASIEASRHGRAGGSSA